MSFPISSAPFVSASTGASAPEAATQVPATSPAENVSPATGLAGRLGLFEILSRGETRFVTREELEAGLESRIAMEPSAGASDGPFPPPGLVPGKTHGSYHGNRIVHEDSAGASIVQARNGAYYHYPAGAQHAEAIWADPGQSTVGGWLPLDAQGNVQAEGEVVSIQGKEVSYSPLEWVGAVASGAGKAMVESFEGVVGMVAHPIRTVEGVASAVWHPVRTAETVVGSLKGTLESVASGDPEALGGLLVAVAPLPGGLVSKGAKAADRAGDMARVAHRAEASLSSAARHPPHRASALAGSPDVLDFRDVNVQLGLEPPGSGAGKRVGVANAVRQAQEAGLIGPGGTPGTVQMGFQTHSTAPAARSALGITAKEAESMHVLPTSFVRDVTGYSRSRALTTLGSPTTHSMLDRHWEQWAMTQRRAGETTCTIGQVERVMREAIDQAPGLSPAVKNTLSWRLELEINELGVGRDMEVALPYPPRSVDTP